MGTHNQPVVFYLGRMVNHRLISIRQVEGFKYRGSWVGCSLSKNKNMKKNCETLIDELGIEMLVGYDYEGSDGYYEEIDNPGTFVAAMIYTELTSVEIVIKGTGIDILPVLTPKQKEYIISLLNYEA